MATCGECPYYGVRATTLFQRFVDKSMAREENRYDDKGWCTRNGSQIPIMSSRTPACSARLMHLRTGTWGA